MLFRSQMRENTDLPQLPDYGVIIFWYWQFCFCVGFVLQLRVGVGVGFGFGAQLCFFVLELV